jgi:uncharacterized protein
MKSRTKKSSVLNSANSPLGRIIVLTGARQTGKTTLVKKCFPDYAYISIEDPILRSQYKNMTAAQWDNTYNKAILDEVQKEPQLIESIKSVYDQYAEPRYILLGSSQILLMEKIRESLAGRCHIEELYPLTLPEIMTTQWDGDPKPSIFQQYLQTLQLPEFLPTLQLYPNFADRQQSYDYYLQFGGYPALVNDKFSDTDRTMWLRDYIRTYLERDIRDLADFRNLEPFVTLQKTTSQLTAQLINYSILARESSITAKTAQKFITYLEISYQAMLLQPWHKNPLKRLNKSPKLHYLDPGIQKMIIQKSGPLTGSEFESAIVAEIFKQAKNVNIPGTFYHLRTLDGREIDLLIELEQGYIAIEIKMGSNVNDSDTRNFEALKSILDKPILQSFLLSNDNTLKKLRNEVLAVPAALFLT